ncbi:hypothetical protein HRG_007282 [Hirsutella rhossiliensis]|uniref:Uncharacterized protein n=1 Tax=Hirsutella rhossiliensis TaxID=111463 RepID=A0A9P8SGK1_9HYPO|nr:uncharacterized protein HRG_07282 [Hirsutella rhossiliensis]KAH0961204.1 hypothetical protein HRG_07282 [Hirsutella rhossiliensis]
MPRKSKNSTKRNSNQFELLDDEDDGTNDNVACGIIVANSTSAADVTRTSARGRPLKPTLQFDPEPRPSRKKSAVPKAKSTNSDPNVNEDSLARIEALLKRVEERAERAEKRVESLEEFIRNELFPRVASPPSPPLQVRLISNSTSTCHLRHHPLRSQGHCQALGWT